MFYNAEILNPHYTCVGTGPCAPYRGRFSDFGKLADSASLGDICASRWRIYGAGPTDSNFDVPPFLRDIRALRHGYTDDGLPCAEDDAGPTRIVGRLILLGALLPPL